MHEKPSVPGIDTRRYFSRPPDRHVLAIVDFRALSDLPTLPVPQPTNVDLLDDSNFTFLGHIDNACLFTWCRHLTYRDVTLTSVGNLCNLISLRLRDTWDVSISGNDMELRYTDLWGDTFQLDMSRTIAETLNVWRPHWQEFQITELYTAPLPQCPRHPFIFKLSCHRHVPGVVLL